jgi:hypothetical protein
VITYATTPLVTIHHVRIAFEFWRWREIRDTAQSINIDSGTPTMPARPPTHKTQSELLQSGLFPKELNDAYALTGQRATPTNLMAREHLLVTALTLVV